jgi:hypothetical protein
VLDEKYKTYAAYLRNGAVSGRRQMDGYFATVDAGIMQTVSVIRDG